VRTYLISYTFGATISVDADNKENAIEAIEAMDTEELLNAASDGFEIQDVTRQWGL